MSGPQLPVPDGLVEAFHTYERALMVDDVAVLDELFAPGPTTLRGDAAGLLVGHDAIAAFRSGRGGAPQRRLVQTHVQTIDADHALVVAVTELARGGRGLQTQLWARLPEGWRVTAAHVSVPAPALDTRIWRVLGDPLVRGAATGPLHGESVAVKDLFGVAGHVVGAGNPAWEAQAAPATAHADVVAALLAAGADVRGIARTDEFAYSLAGTNAHTGTPPNPRAPQRISGGSSSGSASAVSLGHASIGLGTDTGGSIRVPAAYQGLFGLRTTHDAVSRGGLLALAPSFDTVGWLTRDAALLARVGEVLLPPEEHGSEGEPEVEFVVVPELLRLADADVAGACDRWLAGPGESLGRVRRETWPLADLEDWREAFTTWQGFEAWQQWGPALADPEHGIGLDALGADVRSRFEAAARVTPAQAEAARAVLDDARTRIRDLVADRVLVLPSAATTAPLLRHDAALADRLHAARVATLRLTCLAGIGGLPALSIPTTTAPASGGLPAGVCLVAGAGRDRLLLRLAAAL
ncbi:AtzH-like domain-containing protein [Nocardioides sp.]|uniref:AtzH-like domain-containing protein n=1 Tax=Nocardioides sp. TaxID=35761 RepID=UPI003515FD8A